MIPIKKIHQQWQTITAQIRQRRRLRPCPPRSHQSRKGGWGVAHDFCSPKLFTNSCVTWQICTTFAHRSSSAWNLLHRCPSRRRHRPCCFCCPPPTLSPSSLYPVARRPLRRRHRCRCRRAIVATSLLSSSSPLPVAIIVVVVSCHATAHRAVVIAVAIVVVNFF